MMELLNDATFWVAIAFTVFVILFLKFGKAKVLSSLDDKIDDIKKELAEAETLRVSAQELLAEYQCKHKDAMVEATSIINDAKKHAKIIKEKAEKDFAATMERRAAQLEERLSRIEQNATQEINAYTAQIAINATREILTSKMNDKADKNIIANVLENVSKTLN